MALEMLDPAQHSHLAEATTSSFSSSPVLMFH